MLTPEPETVLVLPYVPKDQVWQPIPMSIPVGLEDLQPEHCRWPVDIDLEQIMFCGASALVGKSYCHAHRALSVGRGTESERSVFRAGKFVAVAA